jgi:hypothetical protein
MDIAEDFTGNILTLSKVVIDGNLVIFNKENIFEFLTLIDNSSLTQEEKDYLREYSKNYTDGK